MSRFDNYNNDARRALAQARESALRLNHKTICTEHLLLGLLEAQDPVVELLLTTVGANPARVRQALEFVIGRGTPPLLGEPPPTASARAAPALAEQQARARHTLTMGTRTP